MIREPHTLPDMAEEIDTPAEILAERVGVSVAEASRLLEWHQGEIDKTERQTVATMLARVVGVLCRPRANLKALVHALALAAGLDSLNNIESDKNIKSQVQISKRLGCTRALISHYVCGWSDLLGLHVTKFRKSEDARKVFQQSSQDFWDKAKYKNK